VVLGLTTKVLEEIREELQEIKFLYKELADKLIPVEEATQEEKRAIEEKDEVADEKELMQILG
jgi:archaellum component FlaC